MSEQLQDLKEEIANSILDKAQFVKENYGDEAFAEYCESLTEEEIRIVAEEWGDPNVDDSSWTEIGKEMIPTYATTKYGKRAIQDYQKGDYKSALKNAGWSGVNALMDAGTVAGGLGSWLRAGKLAAQAGAKAKAIQAGLDSRSAGRKLVDTGLEKIGLKGTPKTVAMKKELEAATKASKEVKPFSSVGKPTVAAAAITGVARQPGQIANKINKELGGETSSTTTSSDTSTSSSPSSSSDTTSAPSSTSSTDSEKKDADKAAAPPAPETKSTDTDKSSGGGGYSGSSSGSWSAHRQSLGLGGDLKSAESPAYKAAYNKWSEKRDADMYEEVKHNVLKEGTWEKHKHFGKLLNKIMDSK